MKKLALTLLFAVVAVAMQAATVYLKIGEGRVTANSNLYVWAWDGSGSTLCSNQKWPGDKLTNMLKIGGSDYFVYNVDTDGTYNIIFNGGGNGQTKDILGLSGDQTFVLTSNSNWNYTVTAGAPEGDVVVTHHKIQLIGANYGDWIISDAPEFTLDEETDTYTYVENNPANLTAFKILVNGEWRGNTAFVKRTLANVPQDFVSISSNISDDMLITDAADYKTITLTVKNVNDTWSLKIEGKKAGGIEESTVTMVGAGYGDGAAFTFDAASQTFTFTETALENLASFNVNVDGTVLGNAELTSIAGAADYVALSETDAPMEITDITGYRNATLTVKKDGDAWMLKIDGEQMESHEVTIKGVFSDWNLIPLIGEDVTYYAVVTENMKALADGFGFEIDGVFYAGNIDLELEGDAVELVANPYSGNDLKLVNDGTYEIILTVAKIGGKWTVKANQGKPSAVEAINAEAATVVAGNGEIVVEGAQSVAVYTAAGALVSTDAHTRVAAGLYIVRADNVVKKVIVK